MNTWVERGWNAMSADAESKQKIGRKEAEMATKQRNRNGVEGGLLVKGLTQAVRFGTARTDLLEKNEDTLATIARLM